ncbi:hypothetical protein V2J09_011072 [Rumex salicifolius]
MGLAELQVEEQKMWETGVDDPLKDDDGRPRRTGSVWTASAHIVTAIIGSGVLSLSWGMAQLGWVAGVSTLLIFSAITLYTSNLLADCYRSPNPVSGKRNYTYMHAVRSNLGGLMYVACAIVQYSNLSGMIIGYTITASTSMVAVHKSNCFHKRGHKAECKFSTNPYMIGLGVFEIFLSQIPNFHKLSWLSTLAAVMSFGYSSIGIGLAISQIASGNGGRSTLTGVEVGVGGLTAAEKIWRMFSALGDIAFAYTYSQVLIEIQDTIKSAPAENKVMKKANVMGVATTTAFYMMCGCFGYAAFGNEAPGNMLTGFGFFEPFWLVDLANIFIVIHLVGAYQVFAQPLYSAMEKWAQNRWPESKLVNAEYQMNNGLRVNMLRLMGRTGVVIAATILAMAMPFFNDILGLLGALGFWPLTVYFPVQMYLAQKGVARWTARWFFLHLLNILCLLVAIAAACGSLQGIAHSLRLSKPFHFQV